MQSASARLGIGIHNFDSMTGAGVVEPNGVLRETLQRSVDGVVLATDQSTPFMDTMHARLRLFVAARSMVSKPEERLVAPLRRRPEKPSPAMEPCYRMLLSIMQSRKPGHADTLMAAVEGAAALLEDAGSRANEPALFDEWSPPADVPQVVASVIRCISSNTGKGKQAAPYHAYNPSL